MMRSALVSKHAPQQQAAVDFLRHLISRRTRDDDQAIFQMPALNTEPNDSQQSIIALEPALLTYLDFLKRQKFIQAWEDAIIQ